MSPLQKFWARLSIVMLFVMVMMAGQIISFCAYPFVSSVICSTIFMVLAIIGGLAANKAIGD